MIQIFSVEVIRVTRADPVLRQFVETLKNDDTVYKKIGKARALVEAHMLSYLWDKLMGEGFELQGVRYTIDTIHSTFIFVSGKAAEKVREGLKDLPRIRRIIEKDSKTLHFVREPYNNLDIQCQIMCTYH